jgi:hypothetical protein
LSSRFTALIQIFALCISEYRKRIILILEFCAFPSTIKVLIEVLTLFNVFQNPWRCLYYTEFHGIQNVGNAQSEHKKIRQGQGYYTPDPSPPPPLQPPPLWYYLPHPLPPPNIKIYHRTQSSQYNH